MGQVLELVGFSGESGLLTLREVDQILKDYTNL